MKTKISKTDKVEPEVPAVEVELAEEEAEATPVVLAEEEVTEEATEEATEETVERVLNPRELAIKNIVDARKNDRPSVEEDDGESGEFDVNQQRVDKPAEMDNTSIISEGGKSYLKLKVDGVETKLSVDDAIVELQKSGSADQKLQQAALLLKNAQENRQPKPSTLPDDVTVTAVESKESLKNALTKLYDGDIDEATEVLSSLLSDKSKGNSEQDLDLLVDSKLTARDDDRNLQNAYKAFEKNETFKHILSDPTLSSKMDTITDALQHDLEFQAKNPTYEDYFTEAGTQVNSWVETMTSQRTQLTSDPKPDPVQVLKKRKGEGLQSLTVRRSAPVPVTPKTKGEIIRDMARSRGQHI